MRYAWYESPIGRLVVAKDDVAVRHVTIPDRDPSRPDSPRPGAAKPLDPEPEPGWSRDDAGLAREVAELEAYFAGELREFEMAVAPAGTAFQRRVWAALARIPYGATWSYGELARRAGLRRGASRAVGAANGANPVAVVLPCHRVIGRGRPPCRLRRRTRPQGAAPRPRAWRARLLRLGAPRVLSPAGFDRWSKASLRAA